MKNKNGMTRQIKFRAIPIDGGGFVIGDLVHLAGRTYIVPERHQFRDLQDADLERSFVEIIPSSIGQFTGFIAEKSKTTLDKEVYEGDIFRYTNEQDDGDVYLYSVVVWVRQRGAFYLIPKGCYEDFINNDLSVDDDFSWLFEDALLYDFSVDVGLTKVGNIHE